MHGKNEASPIDSISHIYITNEKRRKRCVGLGIAQNKRNDSFDEMGLIKVR